MPRIFNSVFCQQVTAGNTRLQGEMGGGPLSDVGIYCINAARYLSRRRQIPDKATEKTIASRR
jgi:glucose-fructose oxidoreductase